MVLAERDGAALRLSWPTPAAAAAAAVVGVEDTVVWWDVCLTITDWATSGAPGIKLGLWLDAMWRPSSSGSRGSCLTADGVMSVLGLSTGSVVMAGAGSTATDSTSLGAESTAADSTSFGAGSTAADLTSLGAESTAADLTGFGAAMVGFAAGDGVVTTGTGGGGGSGGSTAAVLAGESRISCLVW